MAVSPYVIPIHDLGRGTSGKDVHLEIPAPERLGTELIGIAAGENLVLDLRIEASGDGVYVTGTLTTIATGECVRCLDPISREFETEISELYLFPEAAQRAIEDGDEEAAEMLRTDGDSLDLEPLVRDDIVSELPFQPLCREDCKGLCPVCGIRLDDAEPGHEHRTIDPRFASLEKLLTEDNSGDAL